MSAPAAAADASAPDDLDAGAANALARKLLRVRFHHRAFVSNTLDRLLHDAHALSQQPVISPAHWSAIAPPLVHPAAPFLNTVSPAAPSTPASTAPGLVGLAAFASVATPSLSVMAAPLASVAHLDVAALDRTASGYASFFLF